MKRNDPWRVETILRVLERTGCHEKAYQSAGINEATYRRWRQNVGFAEQVDAALRRFAAIDDGAIIETFRASLLKAARGGEELVVSTETTVLPDGTQIVKTSQRKQVRPPAEWALRMMAPVAGEAFAQGAKNPSGGVPVTDVGEKIGGLFDRLVAERTATSTDGDSDLAGE